MFWKILKLSFPSNFQESFSIIKWEIDITTIYETGGKYDIMLYIQKIAIAFALSFYITTIIKIIFLTERNIVQVRRQLTPSQAYETFDKEIRNLMIKHVIFFILGLIFLDYFWCYYPHLV